MELITGIFGWVSGHLSELLQIVGAFAVIATMTPNSTDNKIAQWLLDIVNFAGGNVGKAKNG